MRGKKTSGRIVTNFCTGVGVHDVITSANFYDSRVRGLSVVGVKFWATPLTCIVAYNTLALLVVRVCDRNQQSPLQFQFQEIYHYLLLLNMEIQEIKVNLLFNVGLINYGKFITMGLKPSADTVSGIPVCHKYTVFS